MPAFETEGFRESWEYKYQRRAYGEGHEPRALLKSGISVEATCKKCGGVALTDVAMGTVAVVCRRCERSESIDREKLDQRPA